MKNILKENLPTGTYVEVVCVDGSLVIGTFVASDDFCLQLKKYDIDRYAFVPWSSVKLIETPGDQEKSNDLDVRLWWSQFQTGRSRQLYYIVLKKEPRILRSLQLLHWSDEDILLFRNLITGEEFTYKVHELAEFYPELPVASRCPKNESYEQYISNAMLHGHKEFYVTLFKNERCVYQRIQLDEPPWLGLIRTHDGQELEVTDISDVWACHKQPGQ